MTARQRHWAEAAKQSDGPARDLFTLLALPSADERGHSCNGHSVGFRRDGRRGFKCGVCRKVLKWIDREVA